jgi:hypothetical protein
MEDFLRAVRTIDEDGPELIELLPGETSLHFFQKIYRSVRQPMARRMKAAEYALQHEHPKLGAVATMSLTGADFAAMLDRAIERSGTRQEVNRMREVKHIEAQPVRRREASR